MTVVSMKEFQSDQNRYFDLAENENIYIRRGESLFIVTKSPEAYKEPDDDLRKAVSMEVIRERLHRHVHALFAGQ